jgi:hypothetical protein
MINNNNNNINESIVLDSVMSVVVFLFWEEIANQRGDVFASVSRINNRDSLIKSLINNHILLIETDFFIRIIRFMYREYIEIEGVILCVMWSVVVDDCVVMVDLGERRME